MSDLWGRAGLPVYGAAEEHEKSGLGSGLDLAAHRPLVAGLGDGEGDCLAAVGVGDVLGLALGIGDAVDVVRAGVGDGVGLTDLAGGFAFRVDGSGQGPSTGTKTISPGNESDSLSRAIRSTFTGRRASCARCLTTRASSRSRSASAIIRSASRLYSRIFPTGSVAMKTTTIPMARSRK